MNETLTPIEAGLYLNLHVRTIHRLAKNGLIPALKVGRRWRFKKATWRNGFCAGKSLLVKMMRPYRLRTPA